LFRVAKSLLEAGQARETLPLLRELCDAMIEAGEQDNFLKALSGATEKLPGDPEPLEMLADFCGRTSDPFHLNAAQSQLVDAYAAAGNYTRAEELLQGLIERNKDDDRLVQRLDGLRARQNGEEAPEVAHEPFTVANLMPVSREPAAPAGSSNEPLDEETEAYIAQALTDVDLFSSYGLTQKAINLLENVLQRAPRHTPTLERLLDFYLGASNDRRTAELASQLEQIHRERDDTTNAERFAELRQRYQDAAGLTAADMPAAPPAPAAELETPPAVEAVFATSTILPQARVEQAAPPTQAAPAEFEIPLAPAEPEPAAAAGPIAPAKPLAAPAPTPVPATEEVDLSDEWEAMTQEVAEEPEPAPEFPVAAPPPAALVSVSESKLAEEEEELVLELSPASNTAKGKSGPATTEEFLSDLAAEIEDMQAPETPAVIPAAAKPAAPKAKAPAKPAVPAAPPPRPASQPAPSSGTEGMNELADVFEQFRSELDIMNEEAEEDLETHYNLGVAYREMGLLDEAIGEFQKVSKAVQQGKAFPYAMNCAALLALAFMDKGEPKVASVWYQRALETPNLDDEAILALRYDLGAALDLAGEPSLALDNFRQVYAMNIDYRDVADRIAALQKR
jgi:tetratricopeptide (TPR) repeat protein